MTVLSTAVSAGPYVGNGVTTVFPFSFAAASSMEVSVYLNGYLALPGSYRIVASFAGGRVTFLVAPAVGLEILITSNPDFSQKVIFETQQAFLPTVLNTINDRAVVRDLYLRDGVGRALKVPPGDTLSALPSITNRAGKFLAFDGGGNVVASSGTGADLGLRTDLGGDTGTANVRHRIPYDRVGYVGAKGRPLSDKLGYDLYSLSDFVTGPLELANPFDALNLATGANEVHIGNNSELAREIRVPGYLTFPGQNRSVFMRKGQTLNFLGGREHDMSALVNNTKPVIDMGCRSDGSPDPGGLPPRVTGLLSFGGPATAAVVRSINSQGFFIDNLFLTSPGIGVEIGGVDGLIDNITVDQGLTGISLTGQTHALGKLFFYNMGYDVYVSDNSFDITIDRIFSEYSKNASLYLAPSATKIQNLHVGTHRAVLNAQYETHIGFVNVSSQASDTTIGHADYRNGRGAAVVCAQGFNNRMMIGHLTCDGLRTNPGYNQSTTMSALYPANMDLTVRSFDLRNLHSQPVIWAGAGISDLRLNNGRFINCTGGSSEIGISKVNGGTLRLSNVETTRTRYNAGSSVTVVEA